jgi:hypothetical protein
MLVQIKRQDFLKRYQRFPKRVLDKASDDYTEFYPESYSNYILTTGHKTFRGRIGALGIAMTKFIKNIGYQNLLFLGDEDIPWLYGSSDYKPAKAALDYLVQNNVGKRFNGALQVDELDLAIYVKHLAWLTRCNTIVPYVYFTNPDDSIIGHICQYGNLHINIFDAKTEIALLPYLEKSKLEVLPDQYCT